MTNAPSLIPNDARLRCCVASGAKPARFGSTRCMPETGLLLLAVHQVQQVCARLCRPAASFFNSSVCVCSTVWERETGWLDQPWCMHERDRSSMLSCCRIGITVTGSERRTEFRAQVQVLRPSVAMHPAASVWRWCMWRSDRCRCMQASPAPAVCRPGPAKPKGTQSCWSTGKDVFLFREHSNVATNGVYVYRSIESRLTTLSISIWT